MENKKVIDSLYSLCQLDIDAVRAYDTAIEKIDIETIADELRKFRADHQRHIAELSAEIVRLGGQAPENKPDVKGFFIEGMTSLRSVTGTAGALKAMKTNEMLTNSKYRAVEEMDLPTNVRLIVAKGFRDEQRHLAYIEMCINDKVWETMGKEAASNVVGQTTDVGAGVGSGVNQEDLT